MKNQAKPPLAPLKLWVPVGVDTRDGSEFLACSAGLFPTRAEAEAAGRTGFAAGDVLRFERVALVRVHEVDPPGRAG